MPSNINNYQIRKIYAIGGALGMRGTDRQDTLHDLIAGMTGKGSVKDLSYTLIPRSSKYRVISPKEVSGSAYISNIRRTWLAAMGSATIIFVRIFSTTVGSKSKP